MRYWFERRYVIASDGSFTRFGEVYARALDEIRGVAFRPNPWAQTRALSKRVSWLEGQERRRMHGRKLGPLSPVGAGGICGAHGVFDGYRCPGCVGAQS